MGRRMCVCVRYSLLCMCGYCTSSESERSLRRAASPHLAERGDADRHRGAADLNQLGVREHGGAEAEPNAGQIRAQLGPRLWWWW